MRLTSGTPHTESSRTNTSKVGDWNVIRYHGGGFSLTQLRRILAKPRQDRPSRPSMDMEGQGQCLEKRFRGANLDFGQGKSFQPKPC